jgi:peptidoglycan hydrolase-like protein with peptidoglycan-binding domain
MIDDALARLGLADVIMDAAEQTGEMMPTTLPVLTKGANGPAVRRLQALLLANISGLKTDILSVDGDFGPVTDKYVKQFQSAASLVNAQGPSGEVDGITWRALLGLT